jgi:CRP-like cAMP-binding protein/Fe-S-cluster-containing hydrogenase component 2
MQSTLPAAGAVMPGMQHRSDIKSLNAKQIRFEIDMCIGCDRCMLACPVPSSSTITIAELNAATVSQADTLAPQIADFTEACVMCGSCVPVCPVGNHRDLLMLSLKQRLGVSWNGPVDIARVQSSLPAGVPLPSLLAALRAQPLFSQGVPDAYLLHLVAESSIQAGDAGHVLFREGDFGRDIFFILDGQVELSFADASGAALPFALYGRGEYVGDYGMLTGQPHYATAAVCPPGALLLVVREQTMQRLMELVPAARHYFELRNNARSLEAILKRLPLFAGLPDDALRWLAQQTRIRRYERDERLFAEEGQSMGKVANAEAREALHIVLEGFVKVSRRTAMGTGRAKGDERVIAYRQQGDYFAGGLDMLGDQQAVTATAITRVRVAEAPRQALSQIFAAFPAVAQRFQTGLQRYREAADAAHTAMFAAIDPRQLAAGMPVMNHRSDAEARRGLHALVSEGVVEGTDVLVIDLDRCIHCGECEEACARRHGHSRMNRKGMVVGNISIATACRQCQDPVCMLCSRGGIARMPGGEVYITESCIGCGICAERCPYDNISIITLAESRKETPPTWQRFNSLLKHGFGKEAGRKTLPVLTAGTLPRPLDVEGRDSYTEMLKKVAIKCDLCAGYENQACVQACPTGAAFRVNPIRFFGSTEDILRQRAQ